MTEQNIPDVDNVPDYASIIEEQKAVIAAMNEKLNALEAKSSAQDAKITALSKAPAAHDPEKIGAAKSELDKAYEKVLADLGIVKKE